MPLTGIRVVELGSLPAASYTSRLLADFGADVVKVERVEGDAGRHCKPSVRVSEDDGVGVWFAYLNYGKRIVAARTLAGKGLSDLADGADVVIDSRSESERGEIDLDVEALCRRRPDLVVLGMSWFGTDGPYASFQGSDMVCHALAGAAKLVGPAEGPPVTRPDYQAAYFAGLYGYLAVAASLYARLSDGSGRRHDVSVHEAAVALSEYQVADAWELGVSQSRNGISRFAPTYPASVYQCRSGLLGVTIITPAQWASFSTMIGLPELAKHPVYSTRLGRYASADILQPLLVERLGERTAQEWFEDSLRG